MISNEHIRDVFFILLYLQKSFSVTFIIHDLDGNVKSFAKTRKSRVPFYFQFLHHTMYQAIFGKAVLLMHLTKLGWKKRWLSIVLGLALALGGQLCASAEAVAEEGEVWAIHSTSGGELPVVSHGLSVLSAETDVSFSTMVGNDIVFDATGFARGLNLSSVRYITVMSVPSVTDGELLLGSSKIVSGQTVT